MDLKKIDYFFQAAELQNFTKAAEACHIAQTTMSKYLRVLEEELGCPLFTRTHQKVELTKQGQKFYEGMKKISEDYCRLCRTLHREDSRELHIGLITMDYMDVPILRKFEQEYPEYSLYFSFASETRLKEDLLSRRYDALISPDMLMRGPQFQEITSLQRVNLVPSKVILICSGELLKKHGSIQEVIAQEPFITKAESEEYYDACREELLQFYGAKFSEVVKVNGISQQLLMVNLSGGFAIVPESTLPKGGDLRKFSLPDTYHEDSQLVYLKDSVPPVLEDLLRYMHEKKC